ncbi:MAG TPA: glycosyltransferase [Burkholderiales bacterium]|nr:glycosyltransferase [Burkholderiales bacterium]
MKSLLAARLIPEPETAVLGEMERPTRTVALSAAPLISCLMVTGDRFGHFKHSVGCYLRQTYPHKELVIVTDELSPIAAIREHVAKLGHDDVRVVHVNGRNKLGRLRNRSLAEARGDVFCQWDDDDSSHPDRLAVQLEAMRQDDSTACCLQDHFHYFQTTGEVYWTDWDEVVYKGHPGTLMHVRAVEREPTYPEIGMNAQRGEDLVFYLRLFRRLTLIRNMPYLFAYTFHGGNTWAEQHHREIASRAVAAAEIMPRQKTFTREIQRRGLAGPFRFMGPDGHAFTVAARPVSI